MTETMDSLVRELVTTAESPLSSKAEILVLVRRLAAIPLIRASVQNDPLKEGILEVLAACTQDDDRGIYFHGQPVTAALIAEAVGRRGDIPILTRIGKTVKNLGYTRIAGTRTQPPRYRAPKALPE